MADLHAYRHLVIDALETVRNLVQFCNTTSEHNDLHAFRPRSGISTFRPSIREFFIRRLPSYLTEMKQRYVEILLHGLLVL